MMMMVMTIDQNEAPVYLTEPISKFYVQWSNCKIGGRGTLWRAREREPVMPMVRGLGGEAPPPEAEDCFASGHTTDL